MMGAYLAISRKAIPSSFTNLLLISFLDGWAMRNGNAVLRGFAGRPMDSAPDYQFA